MNCQKGLEVYEKNKKIEPKGNTDKLIGERKVQKNTGNNIWNEVIKINKTEVL